MKAYLVVQQACLVMKNRRDYPTLLLAVLDITITVLLSVLHPTTFLSPSIIKTMSPYHPGSPSYHTSSAAPRVLQAVPCEPTPNTS